MARIYTEKTGKETKMKKLVCWLMVLVLCAAAVPALAANVFSFTEKNITLFEGASIETALRREGIYEGAGEITYTSAKPSVATVSGDGTITGVAKGQTEITATLKRDGKRVGNSARVQVKVLRAVNKVTLNTTKLSVYAPDDPAVSGLLEEETEFQVLVLAAGKSVSLAATCTPEDASSRRVAFTTTDAGIAKITDNYLKGMQRGECDLIVSSAQNPEVTETFRVLVIKPVKKIQISAGDRKVHAGSTLQLSAVCDPEDASIKDVVWDSRNKNVATVDGNGLVTGLKKGTVSITATAADGSKIAGSVMLTVTQPVESITFAEPVYTVQTKRTVQTKVTTLPRDASDRSLSWSSSDETIATVKGGVITGQKAGTCTITCTSKSNPEVSAATTVNVRQLVTKIDCVNSPQELNLIAGQSVQTRWSVSPEDATDKVLTFKSRDNRVARVDANGLVTATGRGAVTIIATAEDGSRKQGTVKVNVVQPVTGVSIQQDMYYVQRGGYANVRAVIEPRNANNQRVSWFSDNESIVTARSNGTITGQLYGINNGYTTITAQTEDGGYTATARVRVGGFDELVQVEDLDVNVNNQIKILMRNMSQDITLENIHFKVECFDLYGEPLVCNTDGVSTFFEGDYTYFLPPMERTNYNGFRYRNGVIDQEIGSMVLTVMSWRDSNGITWTIQDEQNGVRWDRYYNDQGQGVG